MTPAVIKKLEEAFLLGCTDREACFFADVSTVTLYKYCNENPEFANRKETLKEKPVFVARKVVMDALQSGDVMTANKLLDRREGSKLAVTGADGGALKSETTVRFVNAPDS